MTSNNKTMSKLDATPVLSTNTDKAYPTKPSLTLDVRSTVSNHLDQYPTTILFSVTIDNTIPDSTNIPVQPTEAFKNIISYITEALPFLIAPISYEPETVLLHLEYINQDIIVTTATYKSSVPYTRKSLLLAIKVPLKILTGYIQDHQTHSFMELNLNPALKSESTLKTTVPRSPRNIWLMFYPLLPQE